jgi:PKHD-type hydroxylase
VRDDGNRRLLYELDTSIRELTRVEGSHEISVRLTACYHNLLRRWGEL